MDIHTNTGEVSQFHYVTEKGYLDKVIQYIENGVHVNVTNGYLHQTALHRASSKGHREIVEFFISKGADVNAKDIAGLSPLYLACENDHRDVAELLINSSADVNVKDKASGWTPLHIGSMKGHRDIVELLINSGADVNVKDDNCGWIPLYTASWYRHRDIVELLINNDADVNVKTSDDGETPLHHASRNGALDLVKLLVSKGADVNVKNDDGDLPIRLAVKKGHRDVVEFFIATQPDSDVEDDEEDDEEGCTPLDIASSQDSSSLQGVDTNNQTHDLSVLPILSRQAFNTTTITLPPQFSVPTVMIDKKKFAYAFDDYNFDPYATPTLVLLFLVFNPDVMLPLSSLREPVFESTLQLIEDLSYPNPVISGPADLIPTLLHSIVCSRVAEITYRMYPNYDHWHTEPRSYGKTYLRPPIPHLEKGPIPVLQSVIEDSMVVYNPIKVLISFLHAMVGKYRSLDLPMEQDELAAILLNEDVTYWLEAGSRLSYAYGLFLWDSSRWGVSDSEWDALIQHITIVTTEIFPDAYERISTIERKDRNYVRKTGKISKCDDLLNDAIKKILTVITPCFLYHYRPMKTQLIPHLQRYWVQSYEHHFTSPKYIDAVKAFPTILHGSAIDYVQNPSKFQAVLDTGLPALSPSDVMSKCSQFIARYCLDLKDLDYDDGDESLRWKMPYREYDHDPTPYTYLADCVLRHPPVDDAVYQRISSIFPKKMKTSNVIFKYAHGEDDNPHFTCPPS